MNPVRIPKIEKNPIVRKRKGFKLSKFHDHEFSGFGHVHAECPNYKKSKGKARKVTPSGESDNEEFDHCINKNVNFLAFAGFIGSINESSEYDMLEHSKSSHNDSGEEDDLQMAYNKLFKEYAKLKKIVKKSLENLIRLCIVKLLIVPKA